MSGLKKSSSSEKPRWKTRERRAYVYPGVLRAGVACVVSTDNKVDASAVGTVAISEVGRVLERFCPDVVVVPTTTVGKSKPTPFEAPLGTKVEFCAPGWQNKRDRVRFPLRASFFPGVVGHNAWGMMAFEIMRRGRYGIGSWNMSKLDRARAEEHGPRRTTSDT